MKDEHEIQVDVKIDLIENFNVSELNKDYVKIKIKYYGKIDKIIKKFSYFCKI